MLDISRDPEILNKAVRISKLPEKFRTAQESDILTSLLCHFDIFQKKASVEQLPEVLRIASLNVKFKKVQAGQFLYHKGKITLFLLYIKSYVFY